MMRSLASLPLAVTVSLPALAADAFVGAWKQINEKSLNSEPYYATIRIESAGGDRVKITQDVIRTAADAAAGKKEHTVNEFALDGSELQPTGRGADIAQRLRESVSFRRINQNAWERIAKRPGDIRRVKRWEASRHHKLWQDRRRRILRSKSAREAMKAFPEALMLFGERFDGGRLEAFSTPMRPHVRH
jgi:hypothetical protein